MTEEAVHVMPGFDEMFNDSLTGGNRINGAGAGNLNNEANVGSTGRTEKQVAADRLKSDEETVPKAEPVKEIRTLTEAEKKDIETMQKAGLIDTDDKRMEAKQMREKMGTLAEKLAGDEELQDGDYADLNRVFKEAMEERRAILLKRDGALSMRQVTDKHDDLLSPEGGAVVDFVKASERGKADEVYIKGMRVRKVLEAAYDRWKGDPRILKRDRDDLRAIVYKKGVKLDEDGMDRAQIVAKRKDIAQIINRFKDNERVIAISQVFAAREYIKPENRITKKDVAEVNAVCALGFMRMEERAAKLVMEKQRRVLKRTDLVKAGLEFLGRRLNKFEMAKAMIDGAKKAIDEHKQSAVEKLYQADARMGKIEDGTRSAEIRKEMRTYASESATKEQKRQSSYAQEVRARTESALSDIKAKAESNLRIILSRRELAFAIGVFALVAKNVLVGAGMPVEALLLFGIVFSGSMGVIEKGFNLFRRNMETRRARAAQRNEMQGWGTPSFGSSPTLSAA